MSPETLESLVRNGNPPVIFDVRSAFEFDSGHIPNAVHAPLTQITAVARNMALSRETPVVLVCEHGPRAQLAKVFLKMKGYKKLELLEGHMAAWKSSGRTVKRA